MSFRFPWLSLVCFSLVLMAGTTARGLTYTPYGFTKLTRPGLDSLLANSSGLAVDAADNLHAATANAIIRLSPAGVLTTLAGVSGQAGFVDGTGSGARFVSIQAITLDANGGIFYVIDQHAIRKVTSGGSVTTLAGDPNNPGSNDGTGSAAHFNSPASLTLDPSGNVYVVDRGNYTVRKVTPAGVVTTVAGSAGVPGNLNGFKFQSLPLGIGYTPDTGNIYVSDGGDLRLILPNGTAATVQASLGRKGIFGVDPSGDLIVPTTQAIDIQVYTASPAGPPHEVFREVDTAQLWRVTPAGAATILGGETISTISDNDTSSHSGTLVEGYGAVARLPGAASALSFTTDGRIFVRYATSSGDIVAVAAPPTTPLPQHAPVIGAVSVVSTPSNQAMTFALPVSDPAGDPSYPNPLTYKITNITLGSGSFGSGNLFTFYPTAGATGIGSVSFTVSDGYVTARGSANITITPPVTLLANLSTRGQVGTGDNVLITGFVLTGPDTTTRKRVLVRAVGPALTGQGVAHPVARPVITLMKGSTVLDRNQGWGTASNPSDLDYTAATVGAFNLTAGSNDSALIASLTPGAYTAIVSSADGSPGLALAEVYDADASNPVHHPVNVSTRGYVGTGDNVLIAGVAVTGSTPKQFLIRAVGPGLSAFDSSVRLGDPQFHVYKGSAVINHVTGWTNDPQMQAAAAQTGAFPLSPGSADAAAVVTLEPGNYTVIVSSRSAASGIALVEVYQLP